MIKNWTTLILGAGTSINYGYPSGAKLIENILADRSDTKARGFYRDCGVEESLLDSFFEQLFRSQIASIDKFLQLNPVYNQVGKIAIIRNLIECEDISKLLYRNGEDDWYHHFWQKLVEGCANLEHFSRNNVNVITFNYDRSLECYLEMALRNTFGGYTEQEYLKAFESVSFYHVHGILGYLPWHNKDQVRPYGSKNSVEITTSMTDLVKIVHESAQDGGQDYSRASNLSFQSDLLICLGMAYHDENMKKLHFPRLIELENEIYGSSHGMTVREANSIQKKFFGAKVGITEGRNLTTRKFLREVVEFL